MYWNLGVSWMQQSIIQKQIAQMEPTSRCSVYFQIMPSLNDGMWSDTEMFEVWRELIVWYSSEIQVIPNRIHLYHNQTLNIHNNAFKQYWQIINVSISRRTSQYLSYFNQYFLLKALLHNSIAAQCSFNYTFLNKSFILLYKTLLEKTNTDNINKTKHLD